MFLYGVFSDCSGLQSRCKSIILRSLAWSLIRPLNTTHPLEANPFVLLIKQHLLILPSENTPSEMKQYNLHCEADLTPKTGSFQPCSSVLCLPLLSCAGFVWRHGLVSAVFTEPCPDPVVRGLIVEISPEDFSPLFHLVHLFSSFQSWMGQQ